MGYTRENGARWSFGLRYWEILLNFHASAEASNILGYYAVTRLRYHNLLLSVSAFIPRTVTLILSRSIVNSMVYL